MHLMTLSLFLLSVKVGFIQVQNIIHCTYQFCASPGFNYVKCIVEGARYIVNATVFNRTTSSKCDGVILSGYRDNFVWVDHGCHAYFDVCAAYRATTLTASTTLAISMSHTTSSLSTIKQTSAMISQEITRPVTNQPTATMNPQQIITTSAPSTTLSLPATNAFMTQGSTTSTAVMLTTMLAGSSKSSEMNIKAEESTTTHTKGSSGISSNTAIMAGALAAGFAFLAVGIGFSKFMLSRNAVTRVSPLIREGRPQVEERGTSMSPEVREISRSAFDTTKLAIQNGL